MLETNPKTKEVPNGELPPVGINVIVQCQDLRCLAYRDPDGTWRSTFTRQEVKNVIRYFVLA